MKILRRVFETAEILFALPLLVYSAVLIARISTGGTGRLGGDVIAAAYFLAALSAASGAIALYLQRREASTRLALVAHLVVAVAIATWFALHVSGTVYSHASLFHSYPEN